MATPLVGPPVPINAQLKKDQTRAMAAGRAMTESQNHSNTILQTQDDGEEAKYVIYVYNICELEHVRNQPPEFPSFKIEKCPKGEEFSVTTLPAFIKERYEKPGETEYFYRKVDGRRYATSLLNPDTFPGTDFNAQLIEGRTGNDDMTGMNLNAVGVFWSLTAPDDPRIKKEIALFRARVDRTMDALVKEGNRLNSTGELAKISPMMHFAMEYFGLTASWHMSHRHKTECPNCGDLVLEGIAYHRNASGDICIIDRERYEASVVPASKQNDAPAAAPAKRGRSRTQ